MVSDRLAQQIELFIQRVAEPYVLVEAVSPEGEQHVLQQYVPRIIGMPEDEKLKILQRLDRGWRDNQSHGRARDWGRASIGVARFLLEPTEIDEVQVPQAVDVVVRISRWHHTETNLYQRFRPDASFVVRQVWGDIERLHSLYSH
jgi:hypothetical protein